MHANIHVSKSHTRPVAAVICIVLVSATVFVIAPKSKGPITNPFVIPTLLVRIAPLTLHTQANHMSAAMMKPIIVLLIMYLVKDGCSIMISPEIGITFVFKKVCKKHAGEC